MSSAENENQDEPSWYDVPIETSDDDGRKILPDVRWQREVTGRDGLLREKKKKKKKIVNIEKLLPRRVTTPKSHSHVAGQQQQQQQQQQSHNHPGILGLQWFGNPAKGSDGSMAIGLTTLKKNKNAAPISSSSSRTAEWEGSYSDNENVKPIEKQIELESESKWATNEPNEAQSPQGPKIIHMARGFRVAHGNDVLPPNPLQEGDGVYRDDPDAAETLPPIPFEFNSDVHPETPRERIRRRKRKRQRLAILSFFAVTLFAAVVVLFRRIGSNDTDDIFTKLQKRLAVDASEKAVGDTLKWLQTEPNPLSMDKDALEQRFAVALLYFSTGGPTRWAYKLNFLAASSVCDWNDGVNKGVFCNDHQYVNRIYLQQNKLGGYLPTYLARLTQLQELSLWDNAIGGELPPEFSRLAELESLYLSDNQLEGSVPSTFGELYKLRELDLSRNKLKGTLPTQFGLLRALVDMFLDVNSLSGVVPSELGRLTGLEHLHIAANDLVGSIPSSFGNFPSLKTIGLQNNNFGGTLPTELGRLVTLRDLSLGLNPITGSIPTEIAKLSNLERLQLQSASLSGVIPYGIWGLSGLKTLDFSSNRQLHGQIGATVRRMTLLEWLSLSQTKLSGTLPTEVGELVDLNGLDVAKTSLTGTFPTELAQLTNLDYLYLQNNDLTGNLSAIFCGGGYVPDTFVSDCRSAAPLVICDCCTKCH